LIVRVFYLIISLLQSNLYKKQLVSNTPKVVHPRLQLDCNW